MTTDEVIALVWEELVNWLNDAHTYGRRSLGADETHQLAGSIYTKVFPLIAELSWNEGFEEGERFGASRSGPFRPPTNPYSQLAAARKAQLQGGAA